MSASKDSDTLHRFTLENTAIRGELAHLQQSVRDALQHQQYPPQIRRLIAEFMAAASLLASSIKIEGVLSLQAKTDAGLVVMAEADTTGGIRAIARGADDVKASDTAQLLNTGILAITITPLKGQRYQGIVPLNGDNLAVCLEHYFMQSEQLPTRFWFAADDDGSKAAALMLQVLPSTPVSDDEWQQASSFGDTVNPTELLETPSETLLFQLFNHFGVRMQAANKLQFNCSCSTTRSLSALRAIGELEARKLLSEQGLITMDCEFCGQHYRFDEAAVDALFEADGDASLGTNGKVLH